MSTDAKEYYASARESVTKVRSAAPGVASAFVNFYRATMQAGELSVREKELIALAVGLAMRCDHCIYAHARGAVKAGATRQQIIEAAGVAVMMQGGPTYTQLPLLLDALDVIEAEAKAA